MLIESLRRTIIACPAFCLLAATLACGTLSADEKEDLNFVGALRWATNEEGAELLELSDETRKKLAELVAARDAEGRRLLANPDLTESDKQKLRSSFSQESERLGQPILSLAQRENLIQLLLAREGLVTLARPDVSQILALTESQRAEIANVLQTRQRAIDTARGLRREIAIRNNERRLQALLTPLQLTKWQQMAGLDGPDAEQATAVGAAGDQPTREAATPAPNPPQVRLQFTFERMPWRAVIDWLAEEADLSVYVSTMPPGSLTYTDENEYTPDQAIERINRFLIPIGYTLLRSGKMVSVIGLDDGHRDQLLNALAEYADLSDLDRRGDHEVLKCIFTIAKAEPQEALEEISGLVRLSTPLLLPKSKQILVIDTASQLRMVRNVLEAMENPSPEGGPVRRFALKHVLATEVFGALRPLVGIDDESSNIGPDVSLAASADGKEVFATGAAEKLAIVESVVLMLDESPAERDATSAPTLRTHSANGADLQTVDDVLQTLLAGENVRLAKDPASGRLIALASEDIHQRIEDAIAELEGEIPVFEALQMKRVEPYVAITVIREMFDIPFYTDEEDEDKDHPRLDWDSRSMRIFVRGKRTQVEEIKQIVEQLEQPRESKRGPLRLLPLHGERAQRLLETGKRFWPGDDEVLVFPPDTDDTPNEVLERVINDQPTATPPINRAPSPPAKPRASDNTRPARLPDTIFVDLRQDTGTSPDGASQIPPTPAVGSNVIKAQVTPRGILLHSEDAELLNRFEEHLRTIAGPGELSATRMAIFYLRHLPAEDAKALLIDIRRGQSSLGGDRSLDASNEDESLGPPRPGRSYYSYSAPSIITDPRLNRLIVQGTIDEILEIEKNLKIIDRDKSLTDVQTRGKARVIELVHIRAAAAAAIIRDAFPGQIASGSGGQRKPQQQERQQQEQLQLQQLQISQAQLQLQQQQQQQFQQPQGQQPPRDARSPGSRGSENQQANSQESKGRDQRNQRSSGGSTTQGQHSQTQEPQMALSVEESSNSLILRAPDPLFEEVAELVQLIDQKATRTTEVINFRGLRTEYVKQILQGIAGNASITGQASPDAPAPQLAPEPGQ